jgi:hypothetical protein
MCASRGRSSGCRIPRPAEEQRSARRRELIDRPAALAVAGGSFSPRILTRTGAQSGAAISLASSTGTQ